MSAETFATGDLDYITKLNTVSTQAYTAYSLTGRERLTAARTYYVRTDGSDSNTGLANTAGGAFLTVQKAVDVIAESIDNGGYNVTIQIGNGTYTAAVTLRSFVGGGTVIIKGDETTPSNVVRSVTGGNCFTAAGIRGLYRLTGMQLTTTTSGSCIEAYGGSRIILGALDFGAAASYQKLFYDGATGAHDANYTISGSAQSHTYLQNNGVMRCTSKTVTITGTPAFSTAFAVAYNNSSFRINGNTYSGSATGKRYIADYGGCIDTNGAGATYLPGDVAGTATTGYYV